MSEHKDENEDLSVSNPESEDIVSLIRKMQQQLNYLEKKIDILIGAAPSQERPRFSKPFRPSFGHGGHAGKKSFHRGPREGGFNRAPREGGFNRGPREGHFSSGKPREDGYAQDRAPREGGFGQERSFDRKPKAGGFSGGHKPFFRHRKGPRPTHKF